MWSLAQVPLQISQLRLWINREEIDTAVDALASVVASRRFQHHSGASLRLIFAPAFTFPADSAAAFPQLTYLRFLNARTLPPRLPAGLKVLVLEGDGQQLTRLPPDIISTWPQLRRLAMLNMAVDAEQLPRSLSALDLAKCALLTLWVRCSACVQMCPSSSRPSTATAFRVAAHLLHQSAHNLHCTGGFRPALPQHTFVSCSVEPGPVLTKALQACAPRLKEEVVRQIWKGPERRLVRGCWLEPHWDSSGEFVIRNADVGTHSAYLAGSSPHAPYISICSLLPR